MARCQPHCSQLAELDLHHKRRTFFDELVGSLVVVPQCPAPRFISAKLFRASLNFAEFFRAAFALGLSPSVRTRGDGDTLLTFFCRSYDLGDLLDIVSVLCDHGVDPNGVNRLGHNALLALLANVRPVVHRAPDIVRLLVRHKVDVNHADGGGENALWALGNLSSIRAFTSIARVLLEAGVDVKYRPPSATTSNAFLNFLIRKTERPNRSHAESYTKGLYELTRLFVYYGVNVNDETERGRNNALTLLALDCHTMCGGAHFMDAVRLLLSVNIDVNHTDFKRRNVLNVISQYRVHCMKSYTAFAGLLLDSGVNVNNVDAKGNNALIGFLHLMSSVDQDTLDAVSLLARHGINVNHEYKPRLNALWVILQLDRLPISEILAMTRHLIGLGVQVNSGREPSKPFGDSPLLLLLHMRLNRDGDWWEDESDSSGSSTHSADDNVDDAPSDAIRSALHDSSDFRDVDVEDAGERPPDKADVLDVPTAPGHDQSWYDVIKLLLDNGDNPNSVDNEYSLTPLLVLCRHYKGSNLRQIIALLKHYGLDVNTSMYFGEAPDKLNAFDMLLRNRHQQSKLAELIRLLVDYGLKLNNFSLSDERQSEANHPPTIKRDHLIACVAKRPKNGNIAKKLSDRQLGIL